MCIWGCLAMVVLVVHPPIGEHRDDAGPRGQPTWLTVTMELGVSGRVGLVCVPTDLMVIWPLDVVVITIWKKLPGAAVTKKFHATTCRLFVPLEVIITSVLLHGTFAPSFVNQTLR